MFCNVVALACWRRRTKTGMVSTCRSICTLSCCLGGLGMSKAELLLPNLPASSSPDLGPSFALGRYFQPELPLCYSHWSDGKCVGIGFPHLFLYNFSTSKCNYFCLPSVLDGYATHTYSFTLLTSYLKRISTSRKMRQQCTRKYCGDGDRDIYRKRNEGKKRVQGERW